MSVITKIEEQKNKKRVNIFVDEAFFCGLGKETALVFGLKTGKIIDEQTLKEAIFASEVKSAFDKASSYLGTRMHTKFELSSKLIKKGYEKQVVLKAIEKLEEYHYVDDELFAKQFVSQNEKLSKKIIECKLFEKGVDKNIISNALTERNEDDENNLCKIQYEKYIKSKDMSKENSMQKLYASLARKGFSFETIKKVCKNIDENE